MGLAGAQTSHSSLLLLGVVLIALAVRLMTFGPLHAEGYTGDETEYLFLAKKIAAGEAFVDSNGDYSTRSPLYPYLLGGLFSLTGYSLLPAHLAGSLLGTLCVFLVYLVGLRFLEDERKALVAALIASLYPGMVIYSGVLQTESLYMVLVLLFLLSGFRFLERQSRTDAVLMGVWGGLAALARAVFLGFFPVFLALFFLLGGRGRARLYLPLGFSIVTFLLVLTPWTVRNYSIHRELIPISSWGGKSFLIGNNPFATGTWSTGDGFNEWRDQQLEEKGMEPAEKLSEVELSAASRAIGAEYVRSHPGHTILLGIRKLFISWIYPITNSDRNVPLQAAAVGADFFLIILAGIGILTERRHRNGVLVIAAAGIVFTVMHAILHAEARYRLPLVPLLTVFAGSGVMMLFRDPAAVLRNPDLRLKLITLGGTVSLVYLITLLLFLEGKI